MKKEPVWMEEIRQKMKKTRFYGKVDEEREQYKTEYLKTLEALDSDSAETIRRYVEQVEKCEYHHVRIAYLEDKENEKAHQRARKRDFYQLITENNILKTAVVMKTVDYLLLDPECMKRIEDFEELKKEYYTLLRTLPEEEQKLINSYHQAMADDYEIMFHIAAGFPKGII